MNIAVIFAGGVDSRMHSKERPKQFLEMYNKPIIIHTIEQFLLSEEIDRIILAVPQKWKTYSEDLVKKYCKNA